MPRRWPGLSRPLRVEPCPFLCATVDLLDPKHGEFLAMATFAPIVLAALLFEHDDLGAARLLHNLRAHRGVRQRRLADRGGVTVVNREDVGERDFGADLAGDAFDHDLVAKPDAVLLAPSFYNREHRLHQNDISYPTVRCMSTRPGTTVTVLRTVSQVQSVGVLFCFFEARIVPLMQNSYFSNRWCIPIGGHRSLSSESVLTLRV